MSPGFMPWRRNVDFIDCAELPIKSLIGKLSFIADSKHRGYMFRLGVFEINEIDFGQIKGEMLKN
jgi:hypothetical protein